MSKKNGQHVVFDIMPLSRGNPGRIHSHQQPHDNSVPSLGPNLSDIGEDYDNVLHDTVQRGMDDKCRKDYMRRMSKIIEYWEKSCRQYYKVGVQEVTEDDQNNRTKFYFEKYKFDLRYCGINVAYVLQFLMQNDTKNDGKLKSVQDIRKYRDAILWGSKVADERMPQNRCTQVVRGDGLRSSKAGPSV